eukprot:Colp12_sorted_trinity150504_noHs@20428
METCRVSDPTSAPLFSSNENIVMGCRKASLTRSERRASLREEERPDPTTLLPPNVPVKVKEGEHPDVPGLYMFYDFITPEEEQEYWSFIHDGATSTPAPPVERKRIRGVDPWDASDVYAANTNAKLASGRLVRNWGTEVLKTSGMICAEVDEPLPPLPYFVSNLSTRVRRSVRAHNPNLAPNEFDFKYMQCNKYVAEAGHWVDYHVDETSKFGQVIAILTVGSPGLLHIRKKQKRGMSKESKEPVQVYLPSRCLYVMTGESRYLWEHAIPVFGDKKAQRVSIVLRTLTDVNLRQQHPHKKTRVVGGGK